MGRTSYAQSAEDILIAALLGWPTSGFFVDVGANHPIKRSNTYLLYLQGLRGIAVDGNVGFKKLFEKYRPRDTFVPVCIGNGELEEFYIYKDDALSNLGGQMMPAVSAAQYEIEKKMILRTVPLSIVLEQHKCPKNFDLLSIDVEGYDSKALSTVDLSKFFPRLIVIESHRSDPKNLGDDEMCKVLGKFGYAPVAFQGSNIFFLRNGG